MADGGAELPPRPALRTGALVVLSGLRLGGQALPGSEVAGEAVGPTRKNFNGLLAQLLEYHSERRRWFALTSSGDVVLVREKNCQLARARDLGEYNLVLGPASDLRLLAVGLAQGLQDRGLVNLRLLRDAEVQEQLLSVARELEDERRFCRLPPGFEAGFLGKGAKAKALFADGDLSARLRGTPFAAQESDVDALWQLLEGYASERFGFILHSRTPMLLRRTFSDAADEAAYAPSEPSATEVDEFLSTMHRRRVCVLQFVGPSSGTVTLTPRRRAEEEPDAGLAFDDESEEEEVEGEQEPDIVLRAEPGGMLAFLCDRYDYTYAPEGDSLVLQAWFLDEPLRFTCFGEVAGDLEALTTIKDGPQPPRAVQHVSLVGMGVRNPMKADDRMQYWTGLRHSGCDGMLLIPNSRYDMDLYCDYSSIQNANAWGKMYNRHQGHLEGIEMFDNAFFNISNAEAAGMDPEQRLTLETGWNALHDAGFEKRQVTLRSAHIGVFVGISGSDWERCPLPPGVMCGQGGFEAFIAGRFTFCMNLKGPAYVVNTACSASLVSMHQGKLNLLVKEDALEAALTTGISINTTPHTFIGNCQTGALSFMGRSFSFDKSADGFGRSEGTSAAVFKRLEFSTDHYGMLAGSANNHDGRSASLTAPNGPAQERCIKAVLEAVQLEPPEIDCFECHGTGTALGDPIEVGAFARMYKRKRRFIPVLATTSKTNLGHTEGGAGIAGFFKCILMCQYTESSPNIHTRELNPHMDVNGFPVYFNSEGCELQADSAYCGVSSFGVSGTNGHCLAYGRNNASSRGKGQQDPRKVMSTKIRSSPPLVIQHDPADWEEWQNLGRPYHDPGGQYQVEVLKGGDITWRRVERPRLRNPEGPFYIQGSFSRWKMELMEYDPAVDGLYIFEVELGSTGVETFQIVYNLDLKMVYYPSEKHCVRRAAAVSGPGPAPSREDSWLIRGEPDTYFRVEFFVWEGGSRASVTWLPVKD